MLKQRSDFSVLKMIETIDRLALVQGKKGFGTTVRYSNLVND